MVSPTNSTTQLAPQVNANTQVNTTTANEPPRPNLGHHVLGHTLNYGPALLKMASVAATALAVLAGILAVTATVGVVGAALTFLAPSVMGGIILFLFVTALTHWLFDVEMSA